MIGIIPWETRNDSPVGFLDASARVSTAYGWLEINEGAYRLSANSFADTAYQMKRSEVTNAFVEGKYVTNSSIESVTENVEVSVKADNWTLLNKAHDMLLEAFRQNDYTMEIRFEEAVTRWDCFCADIQVTMGRELAHAKMMNMRFSIPRLPAVERREW